MKRKLQVFVSSTYKDLVEERQAAVAAILKAGHIPAGMELFTSGDKSQMKTIERWIDESDVYMLILGGRYGSIEPTTGLSYTELEYDYAISNNKPLFAVVISEPAQERKVKAGGMAFVENENPAALKLLRQKVLKNISSFFDEPKDIKLCIHESLSDLSAKPDLKGWISAAEVEDTKSLHDEIRRLRDENESLSETVKKLEGLKQSVEVGKASSKKTSNTAQKITGKKYSELWDVLKGIEIKIPASLTKEKKETVSDLLTVGFRNKDILIAGVTNNTTAPESAKFYYFNILPKLQAHGLADNERVPGTQYRRAFLNKVGLAFFAELERRLVLKKKS